MALVAGRGLDGKALDELLQFLLAEGSSVAIKFDVLG
jgi:hypothetical protein